MPNKNKCNCGCESLELTISERNRMRKLYDDEKREEMKKKFDKIFKQFLRLSVYKSNPEK